MGGIDTDVAIIGAGPGGATCGAFLRKYGGHLRIDLFERELFPRDHVGESQLPMVSRLLDEIGVWDKVEAANFPIKVGATYRWGKSDDLWDFHFIAGGRFTSQPRPGKYRGQRTATAFQVDRAIYDKILADHAAEMGCKVHYESSVRKVLSDGQRVTGLVLEDGTEVTAKYYVDASGHAGLIRRSMGVSVDEPSSLKNIALWDYWQNADWAVNIGIGGTRVQVMSVKYGWLWFIPLGPTRTSIGLVCPAQYYKDAGLKPEDLYMRAISDEPRIKELVRNGERENRFSSTKDWSFVSQRMSGENWALVGEAMGFADPILAAGLTLTHASARECAFTILESELVDDKSWLWQQYGEKNTRRIRQHIRFADYWYTANAHFEDLKEFTSVIARDAGLELDADRAFQWLGTGGFVEEDMAVGGLGTVSLDVLHQIANRFSERPLETSCIHNTNIYTPQWTGAETVHLARYTEGRVLRVPGLRRTNKTLPLTGIFGMIVSGVEKSPLLEDLLCHMEMCSMQMGERFAGVAQLAFYNCLEAMTRDGWLVATTDPTKPTLSFEVPENSPSIATSQEMEQLAVTES